jgi:hypothetical protein
MVFDESFPKNEQKVNIKDNMTGITEYNIWDISGSICVKTRII